MKKRLVQTTAILLMLFNLVATSCKKEHDFQTLEYKDTFNFGYRFFPDVAAGWTPTSGLPGWYPNTGTGSSSVMGNATMCFTIYAKFKNTNFEVDNIPVSLNKYYAQELAAAGITVPDKVEKIIYDKKQNSIWFKYVVVNTMFEPPTTVRVEGELDIIGGSGNFVNAKGRVKETGYFDAADSTKGAMGIRGTITY